MNKIRLKDLIPSMGIFLLLLILLEVLMTTIFPIIGLQHFRFPLYAIFILFLLFYIDTPYISVLVFLICFVHSLFTIESWAVGTAAGVLLVIIVEQARSFLHLKAPIITGIVTFVFLMLFEVLCSFLLYFHYNNFAFIGERLAAFAPGALGLAILSPYLFSIFHSLWVNRSVMNSRGEF